VCVGRVGEEGEDKAMLLWSRAAKTNAARVRRDPSVQHCANVYRYPASVQTGKTRPCCSVVGLQEQTLLLKEGGTLLLSTVQMCTQQVCKQVRQGHAARASRAARTNAAPERRRDPSAQHFASVYQASVQTGKTKPCGSVIWL
jgi:hypothetical protein